MPKVNLLRDEGRERAKVRRTLIRMKCAERDIPSQAVLARLRPQSFIVDLASRPGGTDFDAARRMGHRAIHALSLPAACAPETAGEAVARTVCDMIGQREEAL